MNISVPDDLAKQVREWNVSISAVCQQALIDEVNRLRVIDDTKIRPGDKVTLRNGDPQKVGDVLGLYPISGGWLAAGTVDVLFVVAWVSWEGKKTLERVDELIKLPLA
jgi:hypothetical protein